MARKEEFQLGKNLTVEASAKEKRSTAVLSVRLDVQELAKLEAASELTGRSIAQLTREALSSYASYVTQAASVTINCRDVSISSGDYGYISRAVAESCYVAYTTSVA